MRSDGDGAASSIDGAMRGLPYSRLEDETLPVATNALVVLINLAGDGQRTRAV
jgi:hypothetical protein